MLAYYNTLRDYIKHEDGLINSRLTWSLTVHGFLLAGFGLMLSKSTDLFAEFDRTATLANPTMHGAEIFFLCMVQAFVAGLGFFIGVSSYGAILAAHYALQSLNRIAHSSAVLSTQPPKNYLTREVDAGPAMALPGSILNISRGTYVAVGDPEKDQNTYEIVSVESVSPPEFGAVFTFDHPLKTEVRALGWALLPKVVAGGDRGSHTAPARTYYLTLPRAASALWACLFGISLLLGAVAGVPALRESVLTLGKSPQPAIPSPKGTPRPLFP